MEISRSRQSAAVWRKHPPTFVGIGSMRCGSTWLYEVLKCHPDIRLSDAKELDFFFLPPMLERDFDWYETQFAPEDGGEPKPVRGEISPRYARLKAWQVSRIAQWLPNLRIILTLRHPVDRVWSQALYEFGHHRQRDVSHVSPLEFIRQVERARSSLSSNYCRTVEIWSRAFGRKALHVNLFEEITSNPDRFVQDVLRHIGATTPWSVPVTLAKKKVWATNALVQREREIPELVRWYIADRLLAPTERLNHLLEGRVTSWVEELREVRGNTRLSWRILRELNRCVLTLPERLAYEAYHTVLDLRLWRRSRELQRSGVVDR